MKSGFSLVEVLVALVVLEVAILGAVGTVVIASRTMSEAEAIESAVSALEGTADSLSLTATAGEGDKDVAGGRIHWSVESDGGFTLEFIRDERVWLWVAGVVLMTDS